LTKKQFLSLKKGDLLSDRHNHIYIFIKKEKVTDISVYGHAVYAITLYTLGVYINPTPNKMILRKMFEPWVYYDKK
jgi:hypothetical protein